MHQHHKFQGKFLGLLGVIYFLGPPVGDNDRVWSLRFYREFNDWELVASYSLLHSSKPEFRGGGGGGCDRLCWVLNGSGEFDIRFFYHKI